MENIPVGSISSASYEWSVTDKDSNGNYFPGKYDIAADLWFAPPSLADAPVPAPGDTEVMIWMDEQNVNPTGTNIGTITKGGINYQVYCLNNNGGVTISFESTQPDQITNVNIVDFIRYLENSTNFDNTNCNNGNPPLASSWYLRQIPVGFEIWNGGVGLEVDSFSESVTSK